MTEYTVQNMITEIVKDEREITAYFSSYDKKLGDQVGKNGVTKIEGYKEIKTYESGFISIEPYLAIYKGDTIAFRTPAIDKEIVYAS